MEKFKYEIHGVAFQTNRPLTDEELRLMIASGPPLTYRDVMRGHSALEPLRNAIQAYDNWLRNQHVEEPSRTKHVWKSKMKKKKNPNTAYEYGEWVIYCDGCGVEQNGDNKDDKCKNGEKK